jgi:hypothetical protein
VDPTTGERGDRRLWADLLRRTRRDQELRRRLPAAPAATDPAAADPAATDPELLDELAALERENGAWLAHLVDTRGWPGRSLVGADGAMAAWLLAQHVDVPLQRRLLPVLRAAAEAGEATAAQVAHLEDRVRVGRGEPQRFGTQFRQAADGTLEPARIEDPAGLDDRRAAVGLEPFAAYLRTVQARYGAG